MQLDIAYTIACILGLNPLLKTQLVVKKLVIIFIVKIKHEQLFVILAFDIWHVKACIIWHLNSPGYMTDQNVKDSSYTRGYIAFWDINECLRHMKKLEQRSQILEDFLLLINITKACSIKKGMLTVAKWFRVLSICLK